MKIVDTFPRVVKEIQTLWIPMSDGCRLAARVWLPEDADTRPVPAILELIPYRLRDFTAIRDPCMHAYFAGYGYAGVRVDCRGTGDSEGFMADEYLARELQDGVEIIAWLAAQPWCSGAVGMTGISWGGFNALQVAALKPPALKAIITVCSTDDRYADDVHYMGGCLIHDNQMWASTMLGFNTRPPDPAVVGERWREMWLERMERQVPWLIRWLEHQTRDEFWKHGSVGEDYAAIEAAVYAVGGWADGYSNAIPRLLEGLSGPRKGLVGPWAHNWPFDGRPGPAIGFLQNALRWWDHWLQDIDTGMMEEPMYRVWMQESVAPAPVYSLRPGRWVAESSWPSGTIMDKSLTLSPAGLMDAGTEEVMLTHRSPITVGLDGGEWCPYGYDADLPLDQRSADGQSLCFETEPLAGSTEILGAPVAELVVEVDQPLANLAVRLNDVSPQGVSTCVTYGLLNLTHRESHEHPERLEPGRRYPVSVKLNDVAHQFPAGHRIRLAISTNLWPLVWPSPVPVTLSLLTGKSRLVLPLRTPRDEDGSLAPFAEPESAAPAPHSSLAPYQRARTVTLDAGSGETVVEITKDRGRFQLHDVDIEYAGKGMERISIREGDPLSAVAEADYSITLKRGDWQVRTESKTTLTSTADIFLVSASMDAYEGNERVFTKTWSKRIPRRFI